MLNSKILPRSDLFAHSSSSLKRTSSELFHGPFENQLCVEMKINLSDYLRSISQINKVLRVRKKFALIFPAPAAITAQKGAGFSRETGVIEKDLMQRRNRRLVFILQRKFAWTNYKFINMQLPDGRFPRSLGALYTSDPHTQTYI